VSTPQTRLTKCPECGLRHLVTSLIPHPDRPDILLCPVRTRGVLRLGKWEREEANRLLRSAFDEEPPQ
jgi:hypothetical protein